jgi:hypothetical protein
MALRLNLVIEDLYKDSETAKIDRSLTCDDLLEVESTRLAR